MRSTFIAILMFVGAVLGAVAQNTVSVSNTNGAPGEVVNVDVLLQNTDDVVAAEVVIPLVNKQLTYVDGSCMIDSERANGHRLSAAVVDGALKIYIYSFSGAPLNGDDGRLASFSLKLGNSPAEYPLQPQVVLSDATGKALPVNTSAGAVTILAPQIEVVTPSVDFGRVPIMAQYTKNFTLRNSGTLPLEVSDLQFNDNAFSIAEKSFTIAAGATRNITINYSPTVRGVVDKCITVVSNATNGNATVRLLAEPYSVNELLSSRAEGIAGEEVTVELRMNNMEPIVGLQTTFTLPKGVEYVDGSFASTERASSHTAMASFSNGKLSLFLYSARNAPMSGNDGVVATFRLRLNSNSGSYNIVPQNTVLSNAAQENMVSAVSGEYIVVKSPDIDGNTELDFGRTPVTEVAKANYSVRNNGKATLEISNVVFLAQGYKVANELPLTIEPGAVSVLNVEYLPAAEGAHSTSMNIYSNDPDEKMISVKVTGTVYEPNNLTFEGENLQNGDYVMSIGLDNYTGIVAMQMDIHWMPGMTTSSDRLKVSERLARHSCSITKIDEDTYRFIAFSFGNNNIAGNEGKLFDLTFTPGNGVDYKDTPIVIDNVVLSSSGANNYTSQLALNVPAAYSHYYVRFLCEGKVVSEAFQKVGSTVVYPQMPDREGHSFHWELEGGNKTLAYPIDLASNANEMLYSNAYCTTGGDNFQGWHVLFDDNTGTFFHSEYASNKTSTDGLHHYLRVDLGADNEVEMFSFTYATRRGYTVGSPTRMVVEGSNSADGPYSEIAVLTGMPTYNSTYSSDTLGNGNKYRYIRFRVINTSSNQSPSGHPFFYISEFGMTKYVKVPTLLETVPSNDVVLNGLYTPNNYRVTYKVDGEIVARDSVVYGNEIVLRENPIKEGHTFSGWSEVPATMPASDITIEGSFAVNSYNVIYKVDGEVYATETVAYGSEIILREEPVKEGHTFSGWSEAPATMPAEDVTIEGTFTVNRYAVHYKVDGVGFAIDSVAYGSEIILREDPNKEGHTFSGWSEAPATMPASDITIEGSFAVNSYNVIYKLDGEIVATDSVIYGNEIVLREHPVKEGHTFSGWSETPATMPASDITIEGSFAVNNYTVTYLVDGEIYATETVAYGSEIILREEPTKEGHAFCGWSEAPATMPASNITIEGSFAVNTYNVIYKVDGEEYHIVPVTYGSEITLIEAPTKEGHTFSGWSEAPATMPAEDIVIEGSFAVNNYVITYIVDGELYKTETVAYSSEIPVVESPTKTGYTFTEWIGLPFTMPADNITVEANFVVNNYVVNYIVDGTGYETETVAYNSPLFLIDEPVKEGHTFSGWKTKGWTGEYIVTPIDLASNADEMLSSNTPSKEWERLFNNYTYFSGYTSDGSDAYLGVDLGESNMLGKFTFTYAVPNLFNYHPEKITVTCSNDKDGEYTEIATLTELPQENNSIYNSEIIGDGNRYRYVRFCMHKSNYWICKFGITRYEEVVGLIVPPSTMPASDITIEGAFTVNSYNVIYKVDGETVATDSVLYGNEIVLREHPVKEGHTFSGWSEAPATMPASDITIEGTFTVNSYNVIYKVDGEDYNVVPVTYGSEIIFIEAPTKEGCTFSGWSEVPATMPAEDVTIEGTFTVNRYAVHYKVDGCGFAIDSVAYGSEIVLRENPIKEGHTFSGWSEVPATMPAEDITIEGTFAANSYNVIYKVDGEEYKVESVIYGTEVNLIDAPVKEGHTFHGWNGEREDGIVAYSIELVDNMLYSNAYCTDKTYGDEFKGWHVLFDNNPVTFFHSEYNPNVKDSSDGLEHYIRIDLGAGNEVNKLSFTYSNRQNNSTGSPTKIIVEGCNEANGVYSEIATLTGLPTYNSTYSSDTLGNGNKYRFIRLRVTETSSNQSPSGHPFFYISELGMTKYVERLSIPTVMPAEDVVINGTFTVNSYALKYVVDGEVFAVDSIAYGNEIVLREHPTKEGHTFSGWSEASATMPAEDVTINGAFTVNSYNVIYKLDGEEYQIVPVTYGSEITLIEAPTKEGHTFSGWSEVPATMPAEDVTIEGTFTVNRYAVHYKVDGDGFAIDSVAYGSEIVLRENPIKDGHTFSGWSEVPATMPASDITIEGSFAVNSYNVIYKLDGEIVATDSVIYGNEIVLREHPVKEGHTFSGWSETPATMPASDITIEGSFAVNNYTVTYLVDGEIYATETVAYGSEIVLRDEPIKEGYTFSGWSEAPATMPANDITIEGTFIVNNYTVTYLVDGEVYATETVAYGSEIVLRDEPVKEGHTFSGWSEAPATMPAGDVTINGVFTVNTYNVIYKVDGEEYQVVPVTYGSEITLLDEPTKEGHTFSGWSKAPATMPAFDITIEGTFTVNNYTVTYLVDGEVYATETVAYGSEIVLRDEPTKEGHTFSGWSEAPSTMPANDITIEGTFTVNNYTVTYLVDGEAYATETVAYGSEIVLRDEPTKEGHTFSGWSEAPTTMPAEDVTIEGSFAVNYYAVTYMVDGEVYATDSIAYSNEVILREEPTKEGHTFSGWSEAPATMPASYITIEGSFAVNNYTVTYIVDGEVYATETVAYGSEIVLRDEPTKEGHTFRGWSEAPATMPASDVTIEGSFTVNTYNVIYKVDGEEYQVVPVTYGSEITLLDEPTKEGHTFSGWSEAPSTMPANDITIEGTFTVNNYTVTYLVDGEAYATETVAYGSEIVLRDEPTKEGHTFSDWSEAPETMPANDITIEGTFIVNNYTVTYLVDGEVYATETVAYGSEIVLRDEPTKEGRTFSGWSEAPATMPAEDVTIEGSFTVNTYNVIYKVDGEEYQVVPVTYGSEITLIEAPTKEGHTFSGWSEAPAIMPASDVTIEGSYTVNSYNVIYKVDGEDYKVVPVTYGSEITLLDEPTKEGHTFSGWSEAPAIMPAFDITIEGTFTVNNYTVTYLVDGEVYATETVAYGSEIVLRDEPTKEGRTFSGWSEAPATMPASDVTIEGSFTVNTYNVIYKVDGEEYQVVPVTYGSEITLIEAPIKEGHTFSGWSKAPVTMPAEDITIEGTFTVNNYTVIYLVDGDVYATETVAYGSEIILREEPVKEGHTFSGWSEAPATMPASDVTIEGSFTVNTYNVIYKVDGEEYQVVPVTYGSEITLIEAPIKEGYTFSGWSEAPATMPASDITIEGSFTVNNYTVTYLVDGEVYATETVAYGSEIVLIGAPTKEGYTFSGWSEAPVTMPAEDIVIEGYFTPVTFINGVECDLEELIIYNLKGERVVDTDELERGFYIINGRKVWVK